VRDSAFDRLLLDHRPPKAPVDESSAYAVVLEEERAPSGERLRSAAIFLTNRECPFRCVMCDLWMHTLDTSVSCGAIPRQIASALATLPAVRQVKLYNAGSFFDPRAIPPEDDDAIAETVSHVERVVVESHPAFLRGAHGDRCLRFRDALSGRLEVAVGLETAHPEVLQRLNKRMTVASFVEATAFLRTNDIDLRVFILLKPPFMSESDGVTWACRSIDLAIDCGATACTIIPTRGGNGIMETLDPPFVPPQIASLERAIEYGLERGGCRVFADTWDIERLFTCGCSPARAARLRQMNVEQRVTEPIACECTRR
jgi:radical SAM enzyme (TIGR01210 family)